MIHMTISIVVLTPEEKFLQFLDPELCTIKETCTTNGLRTLSFEYKFQDMKKDKKLFKLGNKIWVQGDNNITDCLYLINTKVKQSIFKDNSFTFECEEVLVELTYAPLFSHLEFTAANGFSFGSLNGSQTIRVDYNSLNYWFGKWFNIGVVQDCLSTYAQYISITGTISPMAILRQIEEETGNVFITRYEKDVLNNTIHRYLDFLNPINVSKDWSLHLEYKFVDTTAVVAIYDHDGNLTSDDTYLTVKPYSSDMASESLVESVKDGDNDGEELYEGYTETIYSETWIEEEQLVDDPEMEKDYTPMGNINPSNVKLRITDGKVLLNTDGKPYKNDGDTALEWSSATVGLQDNTQTALISLMKVGNLLGLDVNDMSFVVAPDNTTDVDISYAAAIQNGTLNPSYIEEGGSDVDVFLPDDSCFEIYDHVNNQVLFRTVINSEIGVVHEEVLDLGFNLDSVAHNIDETDTYTAVSPILSIDENNDSTNTITKTQLEDLITRWSNLTINKGDRIPMVVQRVNIKKPTLEGAKAYLGDYVENSGANESTNFGNWWRRPYKPQDQVNGNNSSENTFEFWQATAYWKAPYSKKKGSLYVETDKSYNTEFTEIKRRNDCRDEKGMISTPKMGTTTSSDEDLFAIYNQVVNYLKEHEQPEIELDLDVANFKNGKYNDYQIWDKIYVKIPDTGELITCRVVEINKEAHDVSKNTIKVKNYTLEHTLKTLTKTTAIHLNNLSYKYPGSKKLTVTLENMDYTSGDIQYPANKLLNFALYKVENGSSTFLKNYTKITDAYGHATLNTKLNPGDYKIEVTFGGDEEFSETSSTCKINVSGKKATKTTNKSKTKSKTTKKTTKTVTKTTYYDKYGRSPDKKKVLGIGRISASGDEGSYSNFYGVEVENRCPHCGKPTLVYQIFWGGEHGDYHPLPVMGNARKGSNMEGAFFCTNTKTCGADYSAQGHEHIAGGLNLKVTKKRFLSSKADAYKLMKGKYIFNKVETKNTSKKVTNNKNRKIVGQISSKIKNLSWSIVGSKTGYEALRAVCSWMDNKIDYAGYGDFVRSPETVVDRGSGNCCDQTRLLLQLLDAAGLTEYYKLYYVHVHEQQGHVYALVENKSNSKRVYIDPASDVHECYGYVCQGYSHGQPKSRYPTRPF